MLEPIEQLPEGVIGFEAKGKLHVSDYKDVLHPAIQEVLERGDDVRIVLVFETFDGLSGGAVWEDLKMGVGSSHPMEADRPGHRRRLDDPRDLVVRVDDAR